MLPNSKPLFYLSISSDAGKDIVTFMGHFLQNMYGGQTPEDLNQNSWAGVWPVYQCFVLFLGSEYDYNVHLRLRTVEQMWANSQL